MSDAVARLSAVLADRYRIERELGAGGMATVYLAEDLKHDRKVAIKVLKPELAAVLGADRFITEIKTTAALQHPNILPLFDSGEAGGFLFYVMPYVEGETLRAKLDRETQLGVDESVKLVREVADALQYAHEHGVVHRDIKPENILLHAGRPMVADFGIALAVSAAAGGRMTETGLSLGTPHYMSPEQATAEKTITNRSDIYSLGAVLYEMLTGEPPHTGTSAQQIIMKIVTEDVAPVTKIRKAVPANVAAAVGEALEKLPADRFESATAFAEALADPHFSAVGAAADGASTSGGGRGFRWWIRSPWSWGAVAIAAGAIVTAIVALRQAASVPIPLFASRTFESQSIFNARFMPDGQTMVFDAMPPVGNTPRLFVIRSDHPDPVAVGPDSTHLLSISNTGQLAVLTHAVYSRAHRLFTGTLATFSLGGEAPHEVTTGVREADWGPDGKTMAVIRDSSGTDLLEYPVGTVLVRSQGYLSDPRISPSGDAVAYSDHPQRWDDRGAVVIVDRSGRTIARSPIAWAVEGMAWRPDGKVVLYSSTSVDSSGSPQAGGYDDLFVRSLDRSGHDHLILSGAGGLTVQDVSRGGRLLGTVDRQPYRLFGRGPGAPEETTWGVRDLSDVPLLSHDGRYVAFADEGVFGGPNYTVLLRKTDGSPPVPLGDGAPVAISDDGGIVVAVVPSTPPKLMLYPAGPGSARRLDSGQFQMLPYDEPGDVRVAGRDTTVFFCGAEFKRAEQCFIDVLPGGSITAVTPPGAAKAWLSPDGKRVLAQTGDSVTLYLVGGGSPQPALGFRPGDQPVRWNPDGHEVWVWADQSAHSSIVVDRVNPETGARTALVTIVPRDLTGVRGLGWVTLANDPHVYAYVDFTYVSQLYTVDGIR
jgi:Protein kinase domain